MSALCGMCYLHEPEILMCYTNSELSVVPEFSFILQKVSGKYSSTSVKKVNIREQASSQFKGRKAVDYDNNYLLKSK